MKEEKLFATLFFLFVTLVVGVWAMVFMTFFHKQPAPQATAVAAPAPETPTITNLSQVFVNVPDCAPAAPKSADQPTEKVSVPKSADQPTEKVSAPKPTEKVSAPKPTEKVSAPKPTVKTSVKIRPISVSSTIRVEPMREPEWYLEIHADLQEMKHRREEMERRIYVSSDDVYPDGGEGSGDGGGGSDSNNDSCGEGKGSRP